MSLELETPVCDLCGGAEQRPLFAVRDRRYGVPGEFNLVECVGCSLRYLSPRPVAAAIAAWYPASYPAYQPRTTSPLHRVAVFCDGVWQGFLSRFLSRSYPTFYFTRHAADFAVPGRAARLLDIGCGGGQKLEYLRRRSAWETYGVDFDPRAVANARARAVGEVHLATGDRLPFADGFFDAVMAWHSLEHHYSPRAAMQEVRRVLRPGGYAIIAVPSGDNLGLRLFGSHWGPLEAPRHLYYFTEETLTRLMHHVGLQVLDVFHDFSFYGLFLDQEIFDSLEYLARDRGIPMRLPRLPGLSSAARVPVLPVNETLGRLWRGTNLILHGRKPDGPPAR
jgi:SAM-dependent methyltransferase